MLQHVLPVPSVAAETDRIERQICPKLILRLVHPIVAKGAFSGEGRRKKEEGRRKKEEGRRKKEERRKKKVERRSKEGSNNEEKE